MGCCENINYLYRNNNQDLSSSFYSKEIKEINLVNEKNPNFIDVDEQEMNSILKSNKFTKIKLDEYKNNKILDKINEVESEYKESQINTRLISKEIIPSQNDIKAIHNLIKNRNDNMNLKKIKGLRKNRSLPEFKTILNKNIFYKKLNEYNENNKFHNNKNRNYHNFLKMLAKSKTDIKFNTSRNKALENF